MWLTILAGCAGPTAPPTDDPVVVTPPPTPLGDPVVDAFDAIPMPAVDVLFVVDNSSSMGEEQGRLVGNLPAFLTRLVDADVDYHLGFIATDAQRPAFSGKLREHEGLRFITPGTPDPMEVVTGMVGALGIISGSVESGRAATWQAIEAQQTFNSGFYREDAELQVVFVTDADDESGDTPISRTEFADWSAQRKRFAPWLQMHAVVTPVELTEGCSSFRSGLAYLDYAEDTEGYSQSICAADWTPLVDKMTFGATGAGQRFELSTEADPGTLEVEVDGQVYLPCVDDATPCVDYRDGAVAVLGLRIAADATVEARYRSVP